MPTDNIEPTSPSQSDTPTVAEEPTTPSEFTFDVDPIALFTTLYEPSFSLSNNRASSPLPVSPLPTLEELLEPNSAFFLTSPKRKASLESIEKLGSHHIANEIETLKKELSCLEEKKMNPTFCNSRKDRNKFSAKISRINKRISGLQDHLTITQYNEALREKDKLIKTLQKTIDEQAEMIQNLKRQLEEQPARQLRKKH